MIRNFLYTVLGLSIFISGGLLGPKIWLVMQGDSEVSSSEQHTAATDKKVEKSNKNSTSNIKNIDDVEKKLDKVEQKSADAQKQQKELGEVVFSSDVFSLQSSKLKEQETDISSEKSKLSENAELEELVKPELSAQQTEKSISDVVKPENDEKPEPLQAQEEPTLEKKLDEKEAPLAQQELAQKNQDSELKAEYAVEKTPKEEIAEEKPTKETDTKKQEETASKEESKPSLKTDSKETLDKKLEFTTLQTVEAKVEEGDNLIEIFQDHTDHKSAYALAKIIGKVHPVTRFQIGKPYTITYDTEKEKITYFEYQINDTEKLIVKNDGDKPHAFLEKIEYDRKLSFVKGEIQDSLYGTMLKLNEKESLALTVVNMFKWDVNFIKDVRKGDTFSILVEKLYLDGKFKGYGRTIGGTFTNNGKKLESFLYHDGNNREMHYNAKGENMRKVLLQSPLRFTRVTSGYTYRRRHPVYGTYRPHLGIDYGAPTGTPIMAVGSGTIKYLGWRGGFGKHITVRHSSGLESLYSHLSRYGRNLRKGSKVRQGQVIGYVGSTGVSTGPHLDFRLKQNGKYINPTKAINPRAASISKAHKQGYEARKKIIREFMDGTRPLESYDPEALGLIAETKDKNKKKKK